MAYIEKRRRACGVLLEKPERRGHLEDLSLGGRIILKQVFTK
jgi:hypothetical protein